MKYLFPLVLFLGLQPLDRAVSHLQKHARDYGDEADSPLVRLTLTYGSEDGRNQVLSYAELANGTLGIGVATATTESWTWLSKEQLRVTDEVVNRCLRR